MGRGPRACPRFLCELRGARHSSALDGDPRLRAAVGGVSRVALAVAGAGAAKPRARCRRVLVDPLGEQRARDTLGGAAGLRGDLALPLYDAVAVVADHL